MGFTDAQIAQTRPALSEPAEEALIVYRALGGWFPERLPIVLTFVDVAHLDGLFDRLLTIRDFAEAAE